jgi:hypothetical protein
MPSTRPVRSQLSALLLVALVAAGCGSDGSNADGEAGADPTPSASVSPDVPVPAGTPDCATIWQDGADLPRTYGGCVDDAGQYVKRDSLGCSSGQAIIRYDDRFYGVAGGSVHVASPSLEQDHEYRAAVLRCRA